MAAVSEERSLAAAKPRLSLYPPSLIVPDPYEAAFLRSSISRGAAGKCWLAKKERRSMILAKARKLIGENGAEKFSLRLIADDCGISLPTIYNIVGDRNTVIREALVEYVHWATACASAKPFSDAQQLFALLEILATSAVNHPDYNTNAANLANAVDSKSYTACHSALSTPINHLLRSLSAQGSLRSSVLINNLAQQLTTLIHSTVCHWVAVRYDADRFLRDLVYGSGLMLLGALSAGEARKFAAGLDEIMSAS